MMRGGGAMVLTCRLTALGFGVLLAANAHAAPDPRTAAGVIAADGAWAAAEVDGDVAAIEALLLPGYRSIGADGRTTSRDAIVASVRRRGGHSEKLAREVAEWKAWHPSHAEVIFYGDTAVLTWVLDASGGGSRVSSCDIFRYDRGRWRAMYSQHSGASQ